MLKISIVNLRTFLLSMILSFFSVTAFASEPINTLEKSGLFGFDPSGTAIRGKDTVA